MHSATAISAACVSPPHRDSKLLADAGVHRNGQGQVHCAASAEAADWVWPEGRPGPRSPFCFALDAKVFHRIVQTGRNGSRVVFLTGRLECPNAVP